MLKQRYFQVFHKTKLPKWVSAQFLGHFVLRAHLRSHERRLSMVIRICFIKLNKKLFVKMYMNELKYFSCQEKQIGSEIWISKIFKFIK